MSDGTHIEWTDATWNPVTGCTMVSAGCTNCYAMGLAATRLRHHPSRAGLTRETGGRPVWTGEVRLNEQWLDQPLRWRRPRMIFVCAHGDLFHEAVPEQWIDRVFGIMGANPQHTYQVLTKRPERMRDYIARRSAKPPMQPPSSDGLLGYHPFNCEIMPPAYVWLGTSVEDQPTADARIPHLLATPAAVRFVSAEPLLGPVDLTLISVPQLTADDAGWKFDALVAPSDHYTLWDDDPLGPGQRCVDSGDGPYRETKIDWVIVGGESGPGARPMHPDWARSLRDQCAAANVPFFFKQHGAWKPLETEADMSNDDGPPVDWKSRPDFVCLSRSGEAVSGYGKRGDVFMRRVGKAQAGRLLDGRTHDAVPEERA